MHKLVPAAVLALAAGSLLAAVRPGSQAPASKNPRPLVSDRAQAPVAPRLFVSPSGSDSSPCSQSSPCATLGHAYGKAEPGDVVALLGGSYDGQTLTAHSGAMGPAAVTFMPAPGASAQVAGLTVDGASFVTLKGITFTAAINVLNENPGSQGSSNVVFASDSAPTIRLAGQISNISILGGSYGNAVNSQPQIKKYNRDDPDSSAPSNVLIDGASFHDYRRNGSSVHTECLQILDGNTITVRRSRFWNCDGTGDIGITPDSTIVNLTLENNFIAGGGDTGYGVQIGSMQRNFVFRYNSSSQSVFFSDSKSGYGPYTFTGNYMPYNFSLCRGGATYSHNVLRGGTCGSSDTRVSSLDFVDAAAHDLHLLRGSAAIGRGDPDSRPAVDIDGDARPQRAAPDAGADEWDSAAIVLGRSIGKVSLGESDASVSAFYGRPASSRSVKLGGRPLRRTSYGLHGGQLWTLSDKGSIVAVGTTSGYYTTGAGVGAGGELGPVLGWRGMSWMACRSSYRGRGAVVTVVTPRGGKKNGSTIGTLALWRRAYLSCPK
jgi:hypothetical protein